MATGAATRVRASLAPVTLLRWSPTGQHLLVGTAGADFFLWETDHWTHARWTTGGGPLRAAAWAPDGRMAVLSTARRAGRLSVLCLARDGPTLTAHLLPLELPEIATADGDGADEVRIRRRG